jgi:lipopolysaccharide export system permease protein
MRIVDSYIFRHTLLATVFVTVVLAALVFLMQSLKFIDLVINAGASGLFIWLQTLLYLPGFFEIILPIGMVSGVLFIYNRLTMDSELIVLRALGFSPFRLARPALFLSIILAILLFLTMGWLAPASKSEAMTLRQDIRAQMSSLIFREGIFNEAGPHLMVYIKDRDNKGRLHGLVIHDSRDDTKAPSTVIARSGVLVSTKSGQQVLVYDGSRQEVDPETGIMRRLDFDQYTIDLPEEEKEQKERWKEPDERSTGALIAGATDKVSETNSNRRQLRVELQKRFLLPFLVPGFALIGLSLLLIGNHDRRGQSRKVLMAVSSVVLLEILFLGSYNLAKQSSVGFPLMLMTVLLPYIGAMIAFYKENIVRKVEECKKS